MLKSLQTIAREKGVDETLLTEVFNEYYSQNDIPIPIGTNVLVEVLPRPKTAGEIILTNDFEQDLLQAVVLSIGDDVKYLSQGDKVGIVKDGGEKILTKRDDKLIELKLFTYSDIKVKY